MKYIIIYVIIGILIYLSSGLLGGILWPYSLNKILFMVEKEPKVKFIHGFLLGLIPGFGTLCIPVSVIVFIISLFI